MKGKKISVVLPMKDFEALMEELEELEDIKLMMKPKKKTPVNAFYFLNT